MLALVGSDGGICHELRDLARQLGVSDHVVFCGEVPHSQMHAYYQSARVLCLPSREEPFGIVLLEAGAFRCPIVTTSVGGIPEILTDGVNARLVPPDDPSELAAQLEHLLDDRGECARLSGALFEHVRTRFSWEAAHHAYVRICANM
jgi:glycosyltransferase involved in cell wall biosynthesis